MTIGMPPAPLAGARETLLVWVNGREMPGGSAQLSAVDRGFTLADGVFETMRARAGAIFRLDAHLARLRRGAAVLHLPVPDDVAEQVRRAADAARDAAARVSIRLTLSRGVGLPGLAPPRDPDPTLVVTAHVTAPDAAHAERGLTAVIAQGRRNERAATAGLKTLSYTESVLALIAARAAGADEALFLDTQEHVSEATASNVFLARGRVLFTPPLSCGVLAGITRAAVLECASARGIAVDVRPLTLAELQDADEAFLTSSVREVVPLVRVDGRDVGSGRPGRLTGELARAYTDLVRAECSV